MAFSLKFYKYAGQILDFFWKTVSYQFIPKLVSYKTMFDRPVGLFPSFSSLEPEVLPTKQSAQFRQSA